MKKMLAVICMYGLLLNCQSVQKVRIIKLAHALDIDHPVSRAMVYMAEEVSKLSNGRMRVDIYPAGQLGGGERDLIELLQIGSLAMTKVSTAPLESFVPEMKVLGLPYLFRDDEHRWKVLEGEIGKRLLTAGDKFFLRGMCYYDAGSRSFYTKDVPIRTPDDLQGLKIRVMKSITSVEMMQALGGSATPIAWGELYTALQQGVVDGAENNPPSFHLSRHYEVCKYYCIDEHTSIPDILLMSTVVWNSLNSNEQAWLEQAIAESVVYQKQLWKEACDKAFQVVQEAGVTVIYPDKQPFRKAVQKIYDAYEKDDPALYALIQKIMNVQ